MTATRLDGVVKLKEREENKALRNLAQAEREVKAAQARADEAQTRASTDFRARNDVSQWEMLEVSHMRALADVKAAKEQTALRTVEAAKARAKHQVAHQAAEVVRRVVDTRQQEMAQEANRAEAKHFDELASLLFVRR